MKVKVNDNKSGAGAVLGGIAAIIAAVAALYGAMHHDEHPAASTQPPVAVQTATTGSNSPTFDPPKPNAVVYNEPTPDPAPHKDIPKPPAPVPFSIEGVWSGRPLHSEWAYDLQISKDASSTRPDGAVRLTGLVSMTCPHDQLQVNTIGPIAIWNPETRKLVIRADGSNQSWYFDLTKQEDDFVGTFRASANHGGTLTQVQEEPIELHKGKFKCPS